MDYSRTLRTLSAASGKAFISFHSGGDIDAVASAIALSRLLGDSTAAAPDKLHSSALRLLERLGYPLQLLADVDTNDFQKLILVDGREPAVFGPAAKTFANFAGKRFIVDHHDASNSFDGFVEFVEGLSSCSEIVYRLWRASGRKLPRDTALLLSCGIMSDSYFFASADEKSLDAFNRCLQASGARYKSVFELCATSPDVSQKVAVMQAVRDAVVVRKGAFVVAYTAASSFEHATATALVACGADVAFACNEKRGIISCVKSPFFNGCHCGKLMQAAGAAMAGSGGGHENAGGCGGKAGMLKRGLDEAIRLLEH